MTRPVVRVVGPAGRVTYLTSAFIARIAAPHETDFPSRAYVFSNPINAWSAAEVYRARHPNVLCDVVDLDDAEARLSAEASND